MRPAPLGGPRHCTADHLHETIMPNDMLERFELHRMADDGCPNGPSGDTLTHDLAELWARLSTINPSNK